MSTSPTDPAEAPQQTPKAPATRWLLLAGFVGLSLFMYVSIMYKIIKYGA